MKSEGSVCSASDIAIVGLSVSVPGASSAAHFWENLRDGVESIVVLDQETLLKNGENPARLDDPNYVPSSAPLDGFADFDAEFFGFSPKEAAILDPQHRKFLEVAWEAMEQSGHPPEDLDGKIGVYAGCGMGSYFYFNICSNPGLVDDVGMFLLRHTGNDKDFLSTRASHVFDLKGPSVNVQTACSTSLVAVHYACEALRDGEIDMALAGGVTIELPQGRGYLYKENEILSPDGHCHAFDHRAQGTVFGSGAGVVALRRLEDAVADGDHIWAVIKGTAINNDGAAKAGYLAPSVDGQAAAVTKALETANVSAETIDHVECHGTGTYLGDPIEVSALTEAYRRQTDATGYCCIGSVKTNIGHLDTAAGVASLAKTAMALHHRQIPPSLGFEKPNPTIDFDTSPFRVNDRLTEWVSGVGPRRGAVNSLGVGGTNAHAILEEAPKRSASEESEFPFHILCLSARSRAALDGNTTALTEWLRNHPETDLADVSFTLKEGRRGFEKRRVVVAETADDAAALLEAGDPRSVFTHDLLGSSPDTVFMFPGGGAQYAGMARDLYETEPVFADWMDRGLEHLEKQIDYDIRAIWLPEPDPGEADVKLQQPSVQLPLIMIVEYALAQLWQSWGIQPAALVGHSMGENTAACLAGVISFEDCIDLVLLRGRLFDQVPKGGMLSISLPLAEVEQLIGPDLDIASVNAPNLTAVSGPQTAIDALSQTLSAREVDHQRIQIDIAAHSRMLEPILSDYRAFLAGLSLSAPETPVISNRSGQPLTPEQATNPDYWVEQLRNTVQFAKCIETLAAPDRVFLEVGPGKALSALAQMNNGVRPGQVLSTLRHPDHHVADDVFFLGVIGRLWACGVDADWPQIWGEARRNRLPLPTYAFQRSTYYIEPGKVAPSEIEPAPRRHDDLKDWFYRPVWRPRLADCDIEIDTELGAVPLDWLIFEDTARVAAPVAEKLAQAGHRVTRVVAGDTFARLDENSYQLPPEQGRHGYDDLIAALTEADRLPDRVGHFWLVTDTESYRPGSSFHVRNLEQGFYSLTYLAQALSAADLPALHMTVFTTGAAQVSEEALPYPEKTMIAGPAGVLPREMPGVTVATVDLELDRPEPVGWLGRLRTPESTPDLLTPRILEELLAEPENTNAALRGERRFGLSYRQQPIVAADKSTIRQGGTYLITGGFGGIGQTLAEHLMTQHAANVILLSRDPLPEADARADWLNSHGPADRTARRIRALNHLEQIDTGAVMAIAADVCNLDQMRDALAIAEEEFGAVHGVIHAAGQIDDGPLLAKTDSSIAKVLAPKITGLQVLDTLFPDGMLEVMVLFSSSSTVTRPAGQVDYIAANEYLNAWAASRRSAATKVVAIDWGVWSEVGMAADAKSAREGRVAPSDRDPCDLPLLDEAGFDASGNRLFASTFSPETSWVFDEHRTAAGAALMPGTGYVELAAQSLAAQGNTDGFEIRDLYFFRPLTASDQAPRETVIRMEDDGETTAFSVHSKAAGGYVLNAQASLHPVGVAPPPVVLDEIAARCPETHHGEPGQRLKSPQETHLQFGPRWHVLQSTALGRNEGLARLSLPEEFRDTCTGWQLHPGLLDLATGWAISLAPGYNGQNLWVPISYGKIRVWRTLPADIRSWIRLSADFNAVEGEVSFDVTLTDPDGHVCVDISGFRMQRTSGSLALDEPQRPDTDAVALGLEAASTTTPLSPEEQRLHRNISLGIRPDEGPEALERALATGLPQVLISSMELPALVRQAAQVSTSDAEGQSFERPQLDTAYVAPRNEVEKSLAGMFEALLGVSSVGVEDSFFDLGGHSLIAVRLFAQIKRSFGVEFPISLLFEAPSVAAIADRIGPVDAEETGESAGTQSQDRQEFTHLVPLHQGDGQATPFFLVAGMFGNVLNLRHLALMLGGERPVFGLQARGLIGDDEPHRTMEDAAQDYIAELKQIQSEGPYLLGGFSGGGITAYEMAQQLKAQGDEVSLLVLLDTPLPVRPALSRRDKALIKMSELRTKGAGYFGEWAGNRLRWELEKRRVAPPPLNAATAFNNTKIEAAFREAVSVYQVKSWQGPLALFRPPLDRHWKVSGGQWVSSEREYVIPDNGWTEHAPLTQVIEVPGDHDSMVLVPNVSVLAERMKQSIDAVETAAPKPAHAQAAE
ncbi:type I polyketide synthase [Primorskyibacter sp. S87]|uniref:type I polyketide synthase n=1 Tax=Primorskyibacter sp. S87 TaxID=3415126 RepID=UPI003C7C7D90